MKRIALSEIKSAAVRHPNLWHELVTAGKVENNAMFLQLDPAKEGEILARYGEPSLSESPEVMPQPVFTPQVEDALTSELTRVTGRAPCRGCGR